MWLGWDTLTAEQLGTIKERAFEALVEALVRFESDDRWGTAQEIVEGPAPAQDGGLDLFVTCPSGSAPGVGRLPRAHSVLPGAAPGRKLVISCKSGKNSLKTQLDEAKRKSERVVEVLAEGGHLVLVVNAQAQTLTKVGKAQSFHDACCDRLAAAYATRDTLAVLGAATLRDQIHLVDADDLVNLLKAWRPHDLDITEPGLLRSLGLARFEDFRHASDWQTEQTFQRERPDYQGDPARQQLLESLRVWILSEPQRSHDQVRVLHGAPGVGKTRLVMEALERSRSVARSMVTDQHDVILDALSHKLLSHCPRAIIVLDDCPPADAESVLVKYVRSLSTSPDPSSRLLVIVPAASKPDTGQRAGGVVVDLLPPLAPEASRQLAASILGSGHTAIEQVVQHTEGYPWFAVLVARELLGAVVHPQTTTEAARYALVGNADRRANPHRVVERARALLGVTLLRRRPWKEVDEEAREAVAKAIGLPNLGAWEDHLRDCRARGLLRDGIRWYVTPGTLVREAWRIVHDPGEPTEPIGPRIRRHCPDLLGPFLEHLHEVGIEEEELAALARSLVADLQTTAPGLDTLPTRGLSTALLHAARYAPEPMLDALEGWLLRCQPEALAAAERARSAFTEALRRLLHDGDRFDRMEPLLFTLAQHDTGTHIGNARDAWTWLFLAWLDVTDAPFPHRLATLARRCTAGDLSSRVFAVRQLARLVVPDALVVGVGDPRPLDPADIARDLDACWALLLDRCADPEPAVRAVAQEALVDRLADRLRSPGLDPLPDKLLPAVVNLPDPLRQQLRESLQQKRVAEVHHALRDRVLRETAPNDFVPRLRELARDVRHTPESLLDHPLLVEGLRAPALPFADALPALHEPESRSAYAWMIAAGRRDTDARLLDALLAHTRTTHDAHLLAWWCLGQRDAGHGDRVRDLVAGWMHEPDPELDLAALQIAVRWGLDDAWAPLVLGILQRSGAHGDATALLDLGDWVGLSASWRVTLGRWLLERSPERAAPVVLAKLDEAKLTLTPDEYALALDAMRRCPVGGLSGRGPWDFHQMGLRLLDTPAAVAVCEVAVDAVVRAGPHADRALWLLLADAAEKAPAALWSALSRALADGDPMRLGFAIGLYPIVHRLPVDEVMAWVGDNPRRAERVVEMVRVDGDPITPLVGALLVQFGPESRVARALAARIAQRPPMVRQHPLDFLAERHAQCIVWSRDPRPAVAQWAQAQAETFGDTLRQETAAATLRRTGT